MPARQPFTNLCQQLASGRNCGRFDLHLHTIYSDGSYSPAQVVELARRTGLAGLAITDHDTIRGIPGARNAAAGSGMEIISGVEITAEYCGREIHLLGYFFRLDDPDLQGNLERLRAHRVGRFREMADRLRFEGLSIDEADLDQTENGSLGRRHLANLLVKTRQVASVREAFSRYLGDRSTATIPKLRLGVFEAIALVRHAGGMASWAHPSSSCTRETLTEFRDFGLGAVEVEYPGMRPGRIRQLRSWAAELGLAVTGGSDCHGPDPSHRSVGTRSVTRNEVDFLRQQVSP